MKAATRTPTVSPDRRGPGSVTCSCEGTCSSHARHGGVPGSGPDTRRHVQPERLSACAATFCDLANQEAVSAHGPYGKPCPWGHGQARKLRHRGAPDRAAPRPRAPANPGARGQTKAPARWSALGALGATLPSVYASLEGYTNGCKRSGGAPPDLDQCIRWSSKPAEDLIRSSVPGMYFFSSSWKCDTRAIT